MDACSISDARVSDSRRSSFCRFVLVAAAAVLASHDGMAAGAQGSDDRPNIVFILADDQGQHQIGCYGTTFYETPHIDRLAAEGMRFTDAYAACPVCSPTRASIVTGKYPARLHLTDYIPGSAKAARDQKLQLPDWTKHLPLEKKTLAEALKSAGYVTGHFGKWHLNRDKEYRPGRPGDPGSQGFDVVLTTHKPGAGPVSPYENDAHHVRQITEHVVAFIEENRNRPFFCYIPHNTIHRPLAERDELIAKYQEKAGSDRPDHNPTVAAMVETLDASVGQILDTLDKLQLADNTIVVYFADNGCMWGPDVLKPLRGGKSDLYEGGIRVPFLVRWPGVIEAGAVCDTPVCSIDFYPTLVECAGETVDDPDVDGMSLLPLWKQHGDLDREAIYWHYPHYHSLGAGPSGAIRKGRFKLIEWFEKSIDGPDAPGALELYDLQADGSEQHDLADERPELVQSLSEELADWRNHVGAQSMSPARRVSGEVDEAHAPSDNETEGKTVGPVR